MTDDFQIAPFAPAHLDAIVDLSLRAWAPVFPRMAEEIPGYVYANFYPAGWATRQAADVRAACLDDPSVQVWTALGGREVAGFIGLRVHPEDNMGEVYILAVDPRAQRRGIARRLLAFAFDWMRAQGLGMAMVETGGDAGHAPSRATYEAAGFERYPVARYFKPLG